MRYLYRGGRAFVRCAEMTKSPTPAPVLKEGSLFAGQYKIGRTLGRGGYGEVYLAEELVLKREVALKILLPQHAENEKVVKRFQAEALAATRLAHPSIAQVYATGRAEGGVVFIAMEFIKGDTLTARLSGQARLGEKKALQIAYQIARCMHLAHAKGIFHRDLKPANTMLQEEEDAPGGERVKILDFGVAKLLTGFLDEEGATATGDLLPGTPTYMAPEQFGIYRGVTGQEGKMDVYALGVMLYKMLSGALPLYSSDAEEMMGLAVDTEPKPLGELVPDIPPSVAMLVHSMLVKKPEDRPSMAQVRDRLGHLLGLAGSRSELPAVVSPSKPEPAEIKPAVIELNLSTSEVEGSLAATADDPIAGAAAKAAGNASGAKTPSSVQKSVGERSTAQQFASADFVMSTGRSVGQQVTGPQAQSQRRAGWRWPAVGVAAVAALTFGTLGIRSLTRSTSNAPSSTPAQTISPPTPLSPPQPMKAEPLPATPAAATAPAASTAPSEAEPASPKVSKAKQSCAAPTEACISESATAAQRKVILEALQEADIKLCTGDRLVVSGKPTLAVRGSGVKKDKQQHLLFALRGSLGKTSFSGEIEIRCRGK